MTEFSAEYKRLLKSPQWGLIRTAVFQRDNWECAKCGQQGHKKGNPLQCNHLRYPPHGSPLSVFLKQPLDDYETLCLKCHKKYTAKSRKERKS